MSRVTHAPPHHLAIGPEHVEGNGDAGRIFFLPGSDGRARRLGERFLGLEVVPHERQHNVYLGALERDGARVDVGAVSTGMGCTSLDVIVTELIGLGARPLLRVGTAGSLVPDVVRAGCLVIATAGVRDEGASDRYITRDYPAVGHLDWVLALREAARRRGLAERTFVGVVHAKDSLPAMELGEGPRVAENHAYMAQLRRMRVLASDMETAHLFVLADVHSTEVAPLSAVPSPTGRVRAGSVLAVVGDDTPFAAPERIRATEEAAIEVALEAALGLATSPSGGG
jgi:uridine phosphorylase